MPRSRSKGIVVNEGNFVAEDGQKFPTKGLWEQQIQRASVATGVTVNEGNALPVANKEEFREQETEEDDFMLSTTQTRKHADGYVAPDGSVFSNYYALKKHIYRNGLKSKIPASSHVATGSAVSVEEGLPVACKEESHHGEERFLEDVQFGTVDWSTLRPLASCLETEEDSLSTTTTSTIDYHYYYTDEEYPSITDDEDDERPTDEEVREVSSYLDSQLGLSHCESSNEWPDKDKWVDSWKEAPPPSRWTWINVFAYFKKGQGYGGYGVILRNAVAKPIIASAKFSKDGKSFFYQVFMGIKAGVDLADKHKCSRLSIHCNSIMIPAIFRDAPLCSDTKCIEARDPSYICIRCERYFSGYKGWNKWLMGSLVVELRGHIRSRKIEELENAWSEPAHYLAKREKKISEVEKKRERTAPDDDKPGDMVPDDFPPELKNLLWQDAFDSSDFMAMQVEDRGPYE